MGGDSHAEVRAGGPGRGWVVGGRGVKVVGWFEREEGGEWWRGSARCRRGSEWQGKELGLGRGDGSGI